MEGHLVFNERIIGYAVSKMERPVCIQLIAGWIENGEKQKVFVCANPHSLMIAEKDKVFKKALMDADLITPDGSGILLASKLLGGALISGLPAVLSSGN